MKCRGTGLSIRGHERDAGVSTEKKQVFVKLLKFKANAVVRKITSHPPGWKETNHGIIRQIGQGHRDSEYKWEN